MTTLNLSPSEVSLFKQMATAWLNHLKVVRDKAVTRGHDFSVINADLDKASIERMLAELNNQPVAEFEQVMTPTRSKPVFRKDGPIIDIT